MEKRIKIAEFVNRLEFGGVESVLINYIRPLDKNKFDFHIVTQDINSQECIQQFKDLGITVHIVTHKRKSILSNIKDICQIISKEHFQIVHSHMTLTNFYVLFLSMLYGVKVRISHSHNSLCSDTISRKFFYTLLSFLNCIAATNYCACGVDAAVFLFGKKNYNKGKVQIFTNAIDTDKYNYDIAKRNEIRNKLNLQNKICIGHVGRLMTQKNQLFLIEIFYKFHIRNPQSVLMILGDGELRTELENKVQELNISDSVLFIGNVNNVNDYYQAMDLFLLPSLFEGLPVVVIESQCCGLPCLISDKVDKSCGLTSTVKFLPICNSNIWVKAISHTNLSVRKSGVDAITLHHYNIKNEAKRLQDYYVNNIIN